MKIKRVICSALAFAVIISGCGSEQNISKPISTQITNPFTDSDGLLSVEGEVIINYGVGLNVSYEDFEHLSYAENKLEIPLKIQNEGSELDVGVMVFVDGFLQDYTSDNNDKSSMQVFSVAEKSEYECELYVNNIQLPENIDNKDYVLSLVNIANPNYSPTSESFKGVYHSGLAGLPILLHMESNPEIMNYIIETDYESHPISDEEKERFMLNEKHRVCNFIFDESESKELPLFVFGASDTGELDLTLYFYCFDWIETDYMLSFYKNHERIKFNDGSDYIRMKAKNGYMNTAPVKLDNINEGDFIYCIAAPVNSFEAAVIKGLTYPIINRNSLPERSEKWEYSILDPEELEDSFAEIFEDEDEETAPEYSPDNYSDDTYGDTEAETGYVLIK